jgi:hypothetical protein
MLSSGLVDIRWHARACDTICRTLWLAACLDLRSMVLADDAAYSNRRGKSRLRGMKIRTSWMVWMATQMTPRTSVDARTTSTFLRGAPSEGAVLLVEFVNVGS